MDDVYLDMDTVQDDLQVSRSTLYLMMQRDGFPRPYKYGKRKVLGWSQKEVDRWKKKRLAEQRKQNS